MSDLIKLAYICGIVAILTWGKKSLPLCFYNLKSQITAHPNLEDERILFSRFGAFLTVTCWLS